jgi:hypothetical protein
MIGKYATTVYQSRYLHLFNHNIQYCSGMGVTQQHATVHLRHEVARMVAANREILREEALHDSSPRKSRRQSPSTRM